MDNAEVDILHGVVKISKKLLSKEIPYKYGIPTEDKKDIHYEDIVTPETRQSDFTNRLLKVQNCKQSEYFFRFFL